MIRRLCAAAVSSNGLLVFGAGCNPEYNNGSLPTGASLDPVLAFFLDDLLDFGTGEFLEYTTQGSGPSRVFTMYFRNRLFGGLCGADAITAVISIHEGSNLIRVSYRGLTVCANICGGSDTLGMQGPGGESAADVVQVGWNTVILDNAAPVQSMTFHPPR
jgi:hypothetical protein